MSNCRIHSDTPMVVKGTRMECPVEGCGYGYGMPKRLPTYSELQAEVKKLEDEVAYLKGLIKTISTQRA